MNDRPLVFTMTKRDGTERKAEVTPYVVDRTIHYLPVDADIPEGLFAPTPMDDLPGILENLAALCPVEVIDRCLAVLRETKEARDE